MPSIIAITLLRIRLHGRMNQEQAKCKCKVGACLLCGSTCSGTCSNDWTSNPAKAEKDRLEREAAKRARMEITKSVELEEGTSNKLLQNTNDLWEAFGWSEATKKKLPSERSRVSDETLQETGGSGWSTMVQSVLSAATRTAEILYPANSHSLLLEVASIDSQKVRVHLMPCKDHDKVIKNAIMIMKTSKKHSVQGRAVARAILVNGLLASRLDALKMDGIIRMRQMSMMMVMKVMMAMM